MALCRLCGRQMCGLTSCRFCEKIWEEDLEKEYLPEALKGKGITALDYTIAEWERMRFAELDFEEGKINQHELETITSNIIAKVLEKRRLRVSKEKQPNPNTDKECIQKIRSRYRHSGTRNS